MTSESKMKLIIFLSILMAVLAPYKILGWVGSIIFALSAAPQAWITFKQGHTKGLSDSLLMMWFVGEIFSLKAMSSETVLIWYTIANYICNLAFLLIIIYYRFYPREQSLK
jgi:uncharacterized protein with PQ loop repeat